MKTHASEPMVQDSPSPSDIGKVSAWFGSCASLPGYLTRQAGIQWKKFENLEILRSLTPVGNLDY